MNRLRLKLPPFAIVLALLLAAVAGLNALPASGQGVPDPSKDAGHSSCAHATAKQIRVPCDWASVGHGGKIGWRNDHTPGEAAYCRQACLECCDLYGGQEDIQRFINDIACNCILAGGSLIGCLDPVFEEIASYLGEDLAWQLADLLGETTTLQLDRVRNFLEGKRIPTQLALGVLNILSLADAAVDICEMMNDGIDEHLYKNYCRSTCSTTYISLKPVDGGVVEVPREEIMSYDDWGFWLFLDQTPGWRGVGGGGVPPLSSGCLNGLVPGQPCVNDLGVLSTVNSDCQCPGVTTTDGCPQGSENIPGCNQDPIGPAPGRTPSRD